MSGAQTGSPNIIGVLPFSEKFPNEHIFELKKMSKQKFSMRAVYKLV
jgi:hypothetical protein